MDNIIYIEWLTHQIEVYRHRIDAHKSSIRYGLGKAYHKKRLIRDTRIYNGLLETRDMAAGEEMSHMADTEYIDWLHRQLDTFEEREREHAAAIPLTRAKTSYYRHRQTAVVAHEIARGLKATIDFYKEKEGEDTNGNS